MRATDMQDILEKTSRQKHILIFGTGSVSEKLYWMLDLDKVQIAAFINSESDRKVFHETPIIKPDRIGQFEYDYVVIATGYTETAHSILCRQNVDEKKIITYIYDEEITYEGLTNGIKDLVNKKYNRSTLNEMLKDGIRLPEIYPAVFWDEDRSIKSLHKDFVREQTLKVLADVITKRGIAGSIAELGVFRGDFTVAIDECFSGKKLYLFDTFEGCDERDIDSDSTIKNSDGEGDKFKKTSVEHVVNRLSGNNDVIVKKGYFPDSFDCYDESFSFVSVDLNLMNPTKKALELFYPRLEWGGYLLVSCYYAPFYEGTMKALNEWSCDNGVPFVPVADMYGSALIVKQ